MDQVTKKIAPLSIFYLSIQEISDHVTKKMAPLIVKRFEFIPTDPGSDWRDLPNTVKTNNLFFFIFL